MGFLKENKINLLIIFLWAFIVIFTMCHHEIWRDEAQAWCIVRDCNFFEIINKVRIEAHPLLWYILLFPIAKCHLPVEFMQIVSFLFVLTSVVFFVLKSPFNSFIKILVVFSSGMLYFLPVVARNYSLIPLFLFLLAYFYKKRTDKPLIYTIIIIFLMNTHGLMFGFCSLLSVLFLCDVIKEIKKTNNYSYLVYPLILIINLLLLFLFLNVSLTDNHVINHYSQTNNFSLVQQLKNFALLYFNYPLHKFRIINIFIFYISIFCVLFVLIKKDKKLFLLLFSSLIFIFYVYSKVWFSGIPYQKAYTLLLIILFCSWVLREKYRSKALSFLIAILFLTSFIPSYSVIRNEIINEFSASKQVAKYIKNNINDENIFIAVGYPSTFTGISAYLPDKKFFSYLNNYYISYYDFDVNEPILQEKEPDSKYFIVQSNFIMNDDLKKIFTADKRVLSGTEQQESFSIYQRIP